MTIRINLVEWLQKRERALRRAMKKAYDAPASPEEQWSKEHAVDVSGTRALLKNALRKLGRHSS